MTKMYFNWFKQSSTRQCSFRNKTGSFGKISKFILKNEDIIFTYLKMKINQIDHLYIEQTKLNTKVRLKNC